MPNVHAKATRTEAARNTVYRRRKNPKPITCAGCDETTTCRCLSEWRIGRQLVEAARRLVGSGGDLAKRRQACRELAELVAKTEQRGREEAALRSFCDAHVAPRPYSGRRDTFALLHMFGEFTGTRGYGQSRSVERTAELFARPVAYVKALRDRALRALTEPVANSSKGRAV